MILRTIKIETSIVRFVSEEELLIIKLEERRYYRISASVSFVFPFFKGQFVMQILNASVIFEISKRFPSM